MKFFIQIFHQIFSPRNWRAIWKLTVRGKNISTSATSVASLSRFTRPSKNTWKKNTPISWTSACIFCPSPPSPLQNFSRSLSVKKLPFHKVREFSRNFISSKFRKIHKFENKYFTLTYFRTAIVKLFDVDESCLETFKILV